MRLSTIGNDRQDIVAKQSEMISTGGNNRLDNDQHLMHKSAGLQQFENDKILSKIVFSTFCSVLFLHT